MGDASDMARPDLCPLLVVVGHGVDTLVRCLFYSCPVHSSVEANGDESSMYCHPTYATHMHGYGVDPNAPRFPYVIPTLLFRPFKPMWQPILGVLAWCFGALYTFMFTHSATDAAASRLPKSSRASATARPVFGSKAASKVSWFKSAEVGQNWNQGKVQEMNTWGQGQRAWEAPGEVEEEWEIAESMLEDEYV